MQKKHLAVVLAVIAAWSMFSCKNDENKSVYGEGGGATTVADNEALEDVDIEYESDLSTQRYDGYNYRICVRKGDANNYVPDSEVGDIVIDAIYRRNSEIEKRYGIDITCVEQDDEMTGLNSILAGDDAYDVLFLHSRTAFTYAIQGACYNINDIESIHPDKPWWYKDAVDAFDVNGYLYVLDGDISLSFSSAMSLFFNKKLFDKLGFEYPYESVMDGEWTFDEFAYYVKKGAKDLDGDGFMNSEGDQFGFFTGEWGSPINILYAGGQKIYSKNDDGEIELSLFNNKTVEIYDEFFSLMQSDSCFMQTASYTGNDIFASGRALMCCGNLGAAQQLRSMDDDFGILPYPKFDEDDEYTTTINGISSLMVVPISVSDVERTGAITEALCAYSARDIVPKFYEVALKTKYSRDSESEEMMDIIKDSIIYDIGYLSESPLQSCGRDMAMSGTYNFASFYAAREKSALESVKSFNEDYGHIKY